MDKNQEKKNLEIEIRGEKEDPTGVSVEVMTLGKENLKSILIQMLNILKKLYELRH
jgi:hypothetical protein